jgi:hypothetical protein
MGIGAISSIGVSGYIYNPNQVSSKSLDKIQRISDDVLDGKLDVKNEFSQENENTLKMGETKDFAAVLEQQMYSGMNKAAKLFGF